MILYVVLRCSYISINWYTYSSISIVIYIGHSMISYHIYINLSITLLKQLHLLVYRTLFNIKLIYIYYQLWNIHIISFD